MEIKRLVENLEYYNNAYRNGEALISDEAYDALIDELREIDPTNAFLEKIGVSNKKATFELPIEMASMFKAKTLGDLEKWATKYNLLDVEFVITPKLDGISMGEDVNNGDFFTRGDGKFGQNIKEHAKYIDNNGVYDGVFKYTNGEVIINKNIFALKYSVDNSNPRNFVGGLLNSDTPNAKYLFDCDYVRYGAAPVNPSDFGKKSDILDALNVCQSQKIVYLCKKLKELTDESISEIFKKWSEDYEIDGLIVEVNDLSLQTIIGRDNRTNNPLYAIAYKSDSFEKKVETEVIGIEWNISKKGKIKPIINVTPVNIDGVIVSNVTGNNARYILNMGIGIGSKVIIKRSGMVIPQIVKVINTVEFEMPDIEDVEIMWDENGVELITKTISEEQQIRNAISFFEILDCDNVGEGVIRKLWKNGYNSIEKLTKIKPKNIIHLDGFGDRKAQIVCTSIYECLSNVELAKLQHASGLFNTLGYLKLKKLEHFTTKPNIEDIVKIDGFAELSAKYYLDSYDSFNEFVAKLNYKLVENKDDNKTDKFKDLVVVFSGIRDAELTKFIEINGGKVSSGGVTSSTTHLVMKTIGSGSSKEVKAELLGVIIMTIDDFKVFLRNS